MKCPFVIKVCKKCKRILVANEINFHKAKNGKHGLGAVCKICVQKEYKEKNFEGNPFNNIDSNKIWNHCPFCIKVCTDCKKILVANETNFNKSKGNKYDLTARCKICSTHRTIIYENKVKEKTIDKYKFIETIKSDKTWNRCPFCIKVCTKCGKILVANEMNFNKDIKGIYKLQSICKGCLHKYQKKWKTNNPDKVFNQRINRRIKSKNQGNGITKKQWYEMMKFFDWKCAYSGESLDKNNRTIDHIIPLDKGGENEVWNLVPMLKLYNCSKYTKNMEEWYKEQEFYSEERLNKIYEWVEYAKNKYKNRL